MQYDSNYIVSQLKSHPEITTEDELYSQLYPASGATSSLTVDNILAAFSSLRLKLAEHMRLDHTIFLFGNGSSMYAGSKDTRAFSLESYGKKSDFTSITDIISTVSRLSGIENQLNALITIQAYFKIVGDPKEAVITTLISQVKEELIDNFVNSIDYSGLDLHQVLFLKLRTFGCLNRTSIFTTNYDLAFEYAMDRLGIEYVDGFSGFINRIFDARTLQAKDKPALVKIHGSVNWISENDTIKEFQPRFESNKVIIDDTAPVLIYPTSNKLYQTYTTPYSELMRHMLNELETGKNAVVVIGYKYGDDHINEILTKAFHNPNNMFYFFLYNPLETGEFIDSIKALSDNMPNVHFFTGKILGDFRNFVKYMLPATPERSDQEKVIELLQKVLVDHES